MEWIIASIYTTNKGIDAVCDMLYDLGITGVEIEDEQEFQEFLEENKKYWDYVDEELLQEKHKETRVKIYLENKEGINENLLSLQTALKTLQKRDTDGSWGRLELSTDGINEEDWANNWKQYFKPLNVGEKILIQPEWEPYDGETDRIVFTVNPGMTFGTGTHFTTKLCIEQLEKAVQADTQLLDIGCGSGILSIIGLLLGAKDATALDIDPAAVHIAYENAEMNHVDTSHYHVFSGDILSDMNLQRKISEQKYDCIVANIVADVIIALLPIVKDLIAPGGTFICSGIIEERLVDVTTAMDEGNVQIAQISHDGGWAAIVCKF